MTAMCGSIPLLCTELRGPLCLAIVEQKDSPSVENRRIAMVAKALKDRLIEEIGKLPEDCLREALDFVGYLRTREGNGAVTKSPEGLDPDKDPLLKFVGGVSHGSLAKEIDEELYGP